MDSAWENVVRLARELDAALEQNAALDSALVERLARAILELQRHMLGDGATTSRDPEC